MNTAQTLKQFEIDLAAVGFSRHATEKIIETIASRLTLADLVVSPFTRKPEFPLPNISTVTSIFDPKKQYTINNDAQPGQCECAPDDARLTDPA